MTATAKVNREEFLQRLETVLPGLAPKDIVEQSSCFVFRKGVVITYNGDVACRNKSLLPVEFEGAVPSQLLLSYLRKLTERTIELSQGKKKLLITGKRKGSKVNMEHEIHFKPEMVEKPVDWNELPEDFSDALKMVQQCASRDETYEILTCVRFHPKWIEACDNVQAARYRIKTGVTEPIWVSRDSVKHVSPLDMTEISVTPSWVHFRNPTGLVLSCKRFAEVANYPNLKEVLSVKGEPSNLPKGLGEAADRAADFSAENPEDEDDVIKVQLKPGMIRISGSGTYGECWELKNIKYQGPPMSFVTSPKLLIEIAKRYNECEIAPNALKINGDKFTYTTCLEKEKKPALAQQEESED